jgi:hypothetical protein
MEGRRHGPKYAQFICEPGKPASIVLAQELAGFRIDPMHPLTSRADYRLKNVTLVAVALVCPCTFKPVCGQRKMKRGMSYRYSVCWGSAPQSSVEPNDHHHGDRRHTKNCYLRCCTRKNVVIV